VQRIVVNAERPEPEAVAEAVEVLRAGGVVAFPTDTVYGLAVDPRNADAIERLFALKGRALTVAVPLIAADLEQAMTAAEFGPRERRTAEIFWPAPLSLVLTARRSISPMMLAGGTTVAIRVPAHVVARGLAGAFGFCVTATSANPSGRQPADSAEAVFSSLPGVDLLLDAGPAPGGAPSTMISFDDDGPVLLRAGAVAWDRVIRSLQ
jgi:L-threonylcarbamoyladenylate synthase